MLLQTTGILKIVGELDGEIKDIFKLPLLKLVQEFAEFTNMLLIHHIDENIYY